MKVQKAESVIFCPPAIVAKYTAVMEKPPQRVSGIDLLYHNIDNSLTEKQSRKNNITFFVGTN